MEDPDQWIREQMPPWATWEENIIEEDGKEQFSEACLWLNVTDSLRLCEEKDGM